MLACEQVNKFNLSFELHFHMKVGGYLAEPKSLQQMELLAGLAGMEAEFTGVVNWWIGLSDLGHEGVWTWVHSYQVSRVSRSRSQCVAGGNEDLLGRQQSK